MFQRLMRSISDLAVRESLVDASRFGDDLAARIEWTPTKPGGTNFRTHRLVQVRPERWEFKATVGMKAFALLFLAIGLGAAIGLPWVIWQTDGPKAVMWLFPVVFGVAFTSAGVFLWRLAVSPRVFDKSVGYFWRGRKSPEVIYGGETSKNWAKLGDIHALQIIAEAVRGNKTTYVSYELNLVLADGRRINVVDHGHYRKMLADAQRLGEFLGTPVWDGT